MTAIIERLNAQRESVERARGHLLMCEQARDDAIRDANAQGMSVREIAAHTGLSYQRIAQIAPKR